MFIEKIVINNTFTIHTSEKVFLQEINGLGFSTKYSVNEILSRHGVKLGNSVLNHKQIQIVLIIQGSGNTDHEYIDSLRERRSALMSVVAVRPYSEDDKVVFDFHTTGGQVLTISGNLKDFQCDLKVGQINATPVSFTIETEFPFLTSKQLYQANLLVARGGGVRVPMAVPADFTNGSTGSTPIANGGNIFSYPIIRFNGPLSNPVLTDLDNEKYLAIESSIASNGYYEINTFTGVVTDQLGNNRLAKMGGDFLVVPAGIGNFILTTDNPLEVGGVSIVYPYSYVSI